MRRRCNRDKLCVDIYAGKPEMMFKNRTGFGAASLFWKVRNMDAQRKARCFWILSSMNNGRAISVSIELSTVLRRPSLEPVEIEKKGRT